MRVTDAQFERASADLREIRKEIAACDGRRAALTQPKDGFENTVALPLSLAGRAEMQWRQFCADKLASLQRDRAALAVREIAALRKTARAFGRKQVLRTLVDRAG